MNIFNDADLEKANFILNSQYSKISELTSPELRELAVVWCFYSGKIEGNTYTYVETEALLKDGITSEKRYEDAKMLKNLHNTFVAELEYINKAGNKELISEATLFRVHRSIIDSLVSDEEAGLLRSRAVRISGTDYVPPRNPTEIQAKLNEILFCQENISNPLERAVYLHCNLAKLQPFIDGNKRTARLIEAVILMNADIIPIYSTKDADIITYRKALIDYYEKGDYRGYINYFLNHQIERINFLSEEKL